MPEKVRKKHGGIAKRTQKPAARGGFPGRSRVKYNCINSDGDIENAMRGNTISDQIWIKTAAFKEQTKQECSICQE